MMKYQYLLFDLDGTLTNPEVGITRSVAYALQQFGIETSDLSELRKLIGPPLLDSFRNLYGFSETQAQQAIEHYREYFTQTGIFENELYFGIDTLLQELTSKGFKVVLATSKPEPYAIRILQHFHLDHHFAFICGSNLDNTRRNKGEIIAHILKQMDITASDCIMIGDREHDILGAQANHMDSIGVLFGFGSRGELETVGATHVVETVEELRALLFRIEFS
jgi:phosphoglycolate phosphatase